VGDNNETTNKGFSYYNTDSWRKITVSTLISPPFHILIKVLHVPTNQLELWAKSQEDTLVRKPNYLP